MFEGEIGLLVWASSPRHYTVDPMLPSSGNPFMSLQAMIPPKRFDIFPLHWGMLRRSRLRSEFSRTVIIPICL